MATLGAAMARYPSGPGEAGGTVRLPAWLQPGEK
jgi:hypothetical protein